MTEYYSPEARQDNLARLAENPYPGRGLVVGLNESGDTAMQAYWVMGRSEGSRARILVEADDPESNAGARLVRTEPYNLPEGTDTSLIIYNAMRQWGNTHVVSNGDQTDTIISYLKDGSTFEEALKTRSFEPDEPNYTPRISAYTTVQPMYFEVKHGLSVIHRGKNTGEPRHLVFTDDFGLAGEGVGHCVHTYWGDGDPLPSFDGTPYPLPLAETIEEVAETYWQSLNPDNRVALVVKGIKIATGEEIFKIVNAHE